MSSGVNPHTRVGGVSGIVTRKDVEEAARLFLIQQGKPAASFNVARAMKDARNTPGITQVLLKLQQKPVHVAAVVIRPQG